MKKTTIVSALLAAAMLSLVGCAADHHSGQTGTAAPGATSGSAMGSVKADQKHKH